MGKGKGSFDHWGLLAPAGKMIFEISAPGLRVEIAKEILTAAGRSIPGPKQFLARTAMKQPAVVGLRPAPVFHAGIKVEGPIDTKVRAAAIPPVVTSKQIGYEKLAKMRKGLIRL